MMRHRWVALTAVSCLISSCSLSNSDTFSDATEARVRASVVRIYYGDGPGQGTGFIVAGEPDVCTVVTSAHVVKVSDYISIETDSTILDRPYVALRAEAFPGMTDLAIITFDAPGQGCPYAPLPLGNSDQVRNLENLYIVGYPELDGRNVQQKHVMQVRVTARGDADVEGYAISYSGDTAAGMSGSPVLNARGQVVGIHGRADSVGWAIPVATLRAKLPEALASLPVTVEDSAEDFFIQGLALLFIGRQEDARQQFEKAIELNPRYALAWKFQGDALADLERYEDALASYARAIELNPDDAEAWYNRGVVLSRLGRDEDALASYARAIELNPDYANAWTNRGVALERLGRNEESLASHDRAIELNPDLALAWTNRGVALERLGRNEESLASYDRAIELNPDDAIAWYNRGVVLRRLGRNEEALASYDRAIELNPDSANAWSNRGVALARLGRYEEALAATDRALELDPNHSNAQILRSLLLEVLQQ